MVQGYSGLGRAIPGFGCVLESRVGGFCCNDHPQSQQTAVPSVLTAQEYQSPTEIAVYPLPRRPTASPESAESWPQQAAVLSVLMAHEW